MKILYFGSSGQLSSKPLEALLDNGFEVCAVAFDEADKSMQCMANINVVDANAESIVALAWAHKIPMLHLTKNFKDSLHELEAYQPDIILVSCYARILPASVTSIATLDCINIHPSLLPAYRGPDPIFWQLRAGESTMGVTIHRVSRAIDGGDILIQQPVTLSNGLTGLEIDRVFAAAAAELLLKLLYDFEHYQYRAYRQKNILLEEAQTYRSFAQADHYHLSNHWPALRLYNFISAYARSGRYFNCSVNDEIFRITQALSFDMAGKQAKPYFIEEDKITFICSSGLIQCRLSHYHL